MTIDLDNLQGLAKDVEIAERLKSENPGRAHFAKAFSDADTKLAEATKHPVILELIRRVREAEKDAARYQELKRQNMSGEEGAIVLFTDENSDLIAVESDEDIDRLCDAGIQLAKDQTK